MELGVAAMTTGKLKQRVNTTPPPLPHGRSDFDPALRTGASHFIVCAKTIIPGGSQGRTRNLEIPGA
jgi:hypothetical protein